ncbi:hypothetical protein EJ04DRAFT_573854 [Polyplosphaeria fusca]|uniref:Uncharacterized protein n=1 Tax=Polyplosphaeria fusca TaxID=682080 RepID=A0A9P4R8J0_9PLEO|nr:hypothetical protein EJ04DRAFT_573854 [Polyplosphaeria fusca]
MATNAPYFQVRGQFTNGTNAQFAPDEEYDLSASVLPQNGLLYADASNPDNHLHTLEENHNLVELLEAATTAAGQATEDTRVDGNAMRRTSQNRGKRKRASSSSTGDADPTAAVHDTGSIPPDRKRSKVDIPTDPDLREHASSMRTPSELQSSTDTLLGDGRAAGVHSAAALFRRSSERTARKHTRPPMSKLFMSLQLTPESFLHLQARAKSYMLDTEHPNRQNCVGNRGKGDTDMVKLRLFNCVREFLDDGAGEQFWGEHVEKPGEEDVSEAALALGQERTPTEGDLVWPRDANMIIGLVTPLLRRMVTNERQRMYAIETRKGGRKKEGNIEAGQVDEDTQSMRIGITATVPIQNARSLSASPIGDSSISLSNTQTIPKPTAGIRPSDSRMQSLRAEPEYMLNTIRIHLCSNERRLKPTKELGNIVDFSWSQLLEETKLLVQSAVQIYPQLSSQSRTVAMGPEALRGLAVAATRVQSHRPEGDRTASENEDFPELDVSFQPKSPPAPPEGFLALDQPDLPRIVVKAMMTTGLTIVVNEDEWTRVTTEVGYSVWAGGLLLVLVELI